DNWKYILVDLGNDTYRPYFNTIVVGFASALLALSLGSIAAYGLVRYRYRPRLAVIGLGIGCIVLAMVAVALGAPVLIATGSAIAVLLLLTPTIVLRYAVTRSAHSVTLI